jgi:hypothetical protein
MLNGLSVFMTEIDPKPTAIAQLWKMVMQRLGTSAKAFTPVASALQMDVYDSYRCEPAAYFITPSLFIAPKFNLNLKSAPPQTPPRSGSLC